LKVIVLNTGEADRKSAPTNVSVIFVIVDHSSYSLENQIKRLSGGFHISRVQVSGGNSRHPGFKIAGDIPDIQVSK